jgi:hypothetical protein
LYTTPTGGPSVFQTLKSFMLSNGGMSYPALVEVYFFANSRSERNSSNPLAAV